MRPKLLGVTALTIALLVGVAAPAFAHVTTDPDSAPKGGEITLGFRVPNEEDNANTVTVEIDIPTDHPLLGVDVEPLAGWTSKSTQVPLNPPIQTDDGPVSQAVNQIVWTAAAGGGIAPGQFQEFHVLVQTLPSDTNQVAFKALQTYSNGDVVRWIDPVTTAQPKPDHPTPILMLTASSDNGGATPAAVDTSKLAKKSSVSTARTIAIISLVIAVLSLIGAGVGLGTRSRASGGSPAT